jgi:tetratricopeptide (TPR) repeat protein
MIVTKGSSASSLVVKDEEKKTGTASHPSTTTDDDMTAMDDPKPFFILDWLEKIIPKDLEIAQQLLVTPQKEARGGGAEQGNLVRPQELFTPSTTSISTDHTPITDQQPPEAVPKSRFYQKSVMIGNAWNAKGLQKAQKDLWEDALLCWQNALDIRIQILGDHHLDVANTYNNIGIALGKIGRYREAIEALHGAQEIRKHHFGEEHTEVAATLHNIGNVYQQSGDYETAVDYFAMSKHLQTLHLGKNHVQVARAAIAIGHANFQACKWKGAQTAYTEAMETLQRAGVPDNDVEVENLKEDIKDVEAELTLSP